MLRANCGVGLLLNKQKRKVFPIHIGRRCFNTSDVPMIETVFQKVVYLVIVNYFICSYIHNGFTYLLADLIVLTNL